MYFLMLGGLCLDVSNTDQPQYCLPCPLPMCTNRHTSSDISGCLIGQMLPNHSHTGYHLPPLHGPQSFFNPNRPPGPVHLVMPFHIGHGSKLTTQGLILGLFCQEPAMMVQQNIPHVPAEHLLHDLPAHQSPHTGLVPTHRESHLPA